MLHQYVGLFALFNESFKLLWILKSFHVSLVLGTSLNFKIIVSRLRISGDMNSVQLLKHPSLKAAMASTR